MTRLEANREILRVLSDFLEKNPDQRFGQALINLNILQRDYCRDDFHVTDCVFIESNDTLRTMRNL